MRFLKYFYQIFESIIDFNKINDWNITYNHGTEHDLNKRFLERTKMEESDFNSLLYKIINVCENDKLLGTWVFFSFTFSIKIITRISDKNLYIITILGNDQETKETKKIKII